MSVNKVILLGNVGRDPEISYPTKDRPEAFFSLATNDNYGGSEVTEWHRIIAVGDKARIAERYIRKGTRLYVEGKLRTHVYTDRLGVERRITQIMAENFELLGR